MTKLQRPSPPGIKVKITGPLLTGNPGRIVQEEVQRSIQETVELGEERLNVIMRPAPMGVFLSVSEAKKGQVSKGNYRRNIVTQVRNLVGLIQDSNIIYGAWLEGTGTRNKTARFKGYASFRKTKQWLNRRKRGLQEKMLTRITRRLGGK